MTRNFPRSIMVVSIFSRPFHRLRGVVPGSMLGLSRLLFAQKAIRPGRVRRRLPARMTLMAQLLKKTEIAEFKALLENLQARLRGDVQQLTTEALGTDREDGGTESKSPTHMAELGSETFEQDFALSLVVNQQETLAEIKVALEKIKDGTYGLCEVCLKEGKTAAHSLIRKERLKAIPYARNCVECERKRSTR